MSGPSTTDRAVTARKQGGDGQVPEGSAEALRLASCVLEVLAGLRSVAEAAVALGVSVARYYQLEQRALQGLVLGCEPARRGRAAAAGGEAARLRAENERLRRDCQRQQALVRLARQAAGLSPPAETATLPGSKKRRKGMARGQRAAERLREAAAAADPERPSLQSEDA